jgi:hypothetical protein
LAIGGGTADSSLVLAALGRGCERFGMTIQNRKGMGWGSPWSQFFPVLGFSALLS